MSAALDTKMEQRDPEAIALVDMDGTLCDWNGALERDYRELMGETKIPPDAEDRIKHLLRRQSGWYRKLLPLSLGLHIVEVLKAIGFRIMILTKAGKHTPNAWTEKVEWISALLPDADMTVTQDKGLVYGRVLVDDHPDHILRWLGWRPRGLVVMPAQEWNKGFLRGDESRIVRVQRPEDVDRLRPRLEEAFRGSQNRQG